MSLPIPDPAFRWTVEPWGHALRCAPLEALAQHLFTSKQLQLPDPEGWRAAVGSVGGIPGQLRRVKQTHGNVVRVLSRGEAGSADAKPDGDAVVSNIAGLVLAVLVADCVPMLVADRATGAAGAIHAGWRGTCARIGPAAVATMRREFGTDPADLVAAIGPSIGPDDYQVGEALIDAFQQAGHGAGDLARSENVFTCGLSTLAHVEMFDSYRAAGDRAGRMAAVIAVPSTATEVMLGRTD